jgi:hypothetical protein
MLSCSLFVDVWKIYRLHVVRFALSYLFSLIFPKISCFIFFSFKLAAGYLYCKKITSLLQYIICMHACCFTGGQITADDFYTQHNANI